MENNAWNSQIGGNHYKELKIQPMEFSMANNLNALQHTIIKYITRYKDKNGIEDIKKAIHCCQLLLEYEEKAKESSKELIEKEENKIYDYEKKIEKYQNKIANSFKKGKLAKTI